MDRPRIGPADETDVLLDLIEEMVCHIRQDLEVLEEALDLNHRMPGAHERTALIERIQTAVKKLRRPT